MTTAAPGPSLLAALSGADARPPSAALTGLRPVAVVAAVLVVAGGLVAAVNSAAPFAHGSWLAAYLVLVGGVSQLALAAGPLLLPAPRHSPRLRRVQLAAWNAGAAVVAIGVLSGSTAVVVAGSVAVLVALGCFAVGAGPSRAAARGRVAGYRLVVAALAISVLVGCLLA
jgi:hypothetical protein